MNIKLWNNQILVSQSTTPRTLVDLIHLNDVLDRIRRWIGGKGKGGNGKSNER